MFVIPQIFVSGAVALAALFNTLFQSSAILLTSPALGILSEAPILVYFISYEISVSTLQAPEGVAFEGEEEEGNQCHWGSTIPGLLIPLPATLQPEPIPSIESPPIPFIDYAYTPQSESESRQQQPSSKRLGPSNATVQPMCILMVQPMCLPREPEELPELFALVPYTYRHEQREQAEWVHKTLHAIFLIFAGILLWTTFMVSLVGGVDPKWVGDKLIPDTILWSSSLIEVSGNSLYTLKGLYLLLLCSDRWRFPNGKNCWQLLLTSLLRQAALSQM